VAWSNVQNSTLEGASIKLWNTVYLEHHACAVNEGVDGILAPLDVNALVPAVNEVIAANVPIVTVDRYVSGTNKPVPQFGVDTVAGGAKLARYVIDHFPNAAKIVFLTGEPGSSPAIDRAKGVRDTFEAAGDKYKIVADQTANFARAQGFTVTSDPSGIRTALKQIQYRIRSTSSRSTTCCRRS
jgi:DNA-binding LacI/PurR family transcriptional regulator